MSKNYVMIITLLVHAPCLYSLKLNRAPTLAVNVNGQKAFADYISEYSKRVADETNEAEQVKKSLDEMNVGSKSSSMGLFEVSDAAKQEATALVCPDVCEYRKDDYCWTSLKYLADKFDNDSGNKLSDADNPAVCSECGDGTCFSTPGCPGSSETPKDGFNISYGDTNIEINAGECDPSTAATIGATIGKDCTADTPMGSMCDMDPDEATKMNLTIPTVNECFGGCQCLPGVSTCSVGGTNRLCGRYEVFIRVPCTAPVGAVGDPHVTNLNGNKFDILQVGTVSLLTLIENLTPFKSPNLALSAMIDRVKGGCSATFIQNVSLWGQWIDQKNDEVGVRVQHWVPKEEALQVRVNGIWYPVQSAKANLDIISKTTASQVVFATHGLSIRVGLGLKISRQDQGYNYLNVNINGLTTLSKQVKMGGLLVNDDWSEVATAPDECKQVHFMRGNGNDVSDHIGFLSSISPGFPEDIKFFSGFEHAEIRAPLQ